jgi:hypothetical protein
VRREFPSPAFQTRAARAEDRIDLFSESVNPVIIERLSQNGALQLELHSPAVVSGIRPHDLDAPVRLNAYVRHGPIKRHGKPQSSILSHGFGDSYLHIYYFPYVPI